MREIVVELVDNFSRHSGSQLAVCAMQWYPNLGQLDFAIGDCGVGIRHSLARKPEFKDYLNLPHNEAATIALEEGVSGEAEGGMGFATVRDDIAELGGRAIAYEKFSGSKRNFPMFWRRFTG